MKQFPELQVLSIAPSDRPASRPFDEASPVVWKSLEELAGLELTAEISGHEFLARVEESLTGPNRRDFIKASAASLALAGSRAVLISRPNRSSRTCRRPSKSSRAGRSFSLRPCQSMVSPAASW